LKNIERVEPSFKSRRPACNGLIWAWSLHRAAAKHFRPQTSKPTGFVRQSHTRLKNARCGDDTGAVRIAGGAARLRTAAKRAGLSHQQQASRLPRSNLAAHANWKVQRPPRGAIAQQASGEARLECPPLGDLESVLRPYQKQGWRAWVFCARTASVEFWPTKWLGKTLQALASWNSLPNRNVHPPSSILHPHLIVCPTSLVFNWVAEAKKFTAGKLKVLALHGP